MTSSPRTLDELRAITDPADRARAVAPYIDRAEDAISAARQIRRDAIASMLSEPGAGPTAVAQRAGVSLSTVRLVRADMPTASDHGQEAPAVGERSYEPSPASGEGGIDEDEPA